jgi:hypothetical protein
MTHSGNSTPNLAARRKRPYRLCATSHALRNAAAAVSHVQPVGCNCHQCGGNGLRQCEGTPLANSELFGECDPLRVACANAIGQYPTIPCALGDSYSIPDLGQVLKARTSRVFFLCRVRIPRTLESRDRRDWIDDGMNRFYPGFAGNGLACRFAAASLLTGSLYRCDLRAQLP